MKVLRADRNGKFVLTKLKDIYKQKRITTKYTALYMHEENGISEQGERTVVTMKDFLLVDNGLSLEFWAKPIDTANYI